MKIFWAILTLAVLIIEVYGLYAFYKAFTKVELPSSPGAYVGIAIFVIFSIFILVVQIAIFSRLTGIMKKGGLLDKIDMSLDRCRDW